MVDGKTLFIFTTFARDRIYIYPSKKQGKMSQLQWFPMQKGYSYDID